jgi:hypothetical protein
VQNSPDDARPRQKEDPSVQKPPGHFVSDELEEQTKRFLEEVKGRTSRRRAAAQQDQDQLGPPPRTNGQRSRRR